jgi:hypothetical protein
VTRRLLPLLPCLCLVAGPAVAAEAVYRGQIDARNNRALFEEAAARGVTHLRITSAGGYVEAGIALGRWVHRNRVEVVVADHCLSSCANYVFPAGARKVIRPGAVVAWHGSYRHLVETGLWRGDVGYRMAARREGRATATRRARAEAERLAALEDAFFRDIGVDPFLCWVGKVAPHRVPDYFTMTVAHMARFGVTEVEAPADYPGPGLSLPGTDLTVIRPTGGTAAALRGGTGDTEGPRETRGAAP